MNENIESIRQVITLYNECLRSITRQVNLAAGMGLSEIPSKIILQEIVECIDKVDKVMGRKS